jgi:hypothetical protein
MDFGREHIIADIYLERYSENSVHVISGTRQIAYRLPDWITTVTSENFGNRSVGRNMR